MTTHNQEHHGTSTTMLPFTTRPIDASARGQRKAYVGLRGMQ
ncbi:hypothetical protein [Streptomyces sp. CB02959]|nr:hypothetical protein [Streptomyces sp. CB02959]